MPRSRGRLASGDPVLALGVRHSRTPDIARMASGAGYGVVWVDLEHSALPIDAAAQIAAAAVDCGLDGWVRTAERDVGVVGRLLDGGASGIIAPKVESAAEAAMFAAACRFPPRGTRSQIALLPLAGFRRLPAAELHRRSDDAVTLQILIESRVGIEAADAIAAIDGVDIVGIGMNDLTADYGCPGDIRHPDVRAACDRVAAAAKAHGKIAIVGGVPDPDDFLELVGVGFAPLIFAGIDTDILATGVFASAADWRARVAPMD